jgi:DNA-directed RNA polymerase I and III subunit RPAC2
MVLARDPNVEFVGYSIPHPSETKMNLRLQTTGADTNEVINEGLRNPKHFSANKIDNI